MGIKPLGINRLLTSIFNNNQDGPFVQSGKTSPSRGEDHRFKSGTAHQSLASPDKAMDMPSDKESPFLKSGQLTSSSRVGKQNVQ